MLCSHCSEQVRPIVVSDIDGTLGDYHTHFAIFAADYWNIKPQWGWWDGSGEFEDWIGIDKAMYREAKLAYRQGGGKRLMPMFQGAKMFLDDMRAAGAEIWLTTTRPYLRLDSTDPDTRFWLAKNGLEYDHLLYDDHKYERLAQLVDSERVVFVLEDLPDQFDQAEEFFPGRTWQINRNHNEAHPCRRKPRLPRLYAASDIARVQIQSWEQAHA